MDITSLLEPFYHLAELNEILKKIFINVPVNKELLTGTVPVNKELLTGTFRSIRIY